MRDLLDESTGEYLPLLAYLDDYEKQFWAINEHGFWKLEAQQSFKEPGFGSWEAFAAGRWDEALHLIEAEREGFQQYFARIDQHGFGFHRVRLVAQPIAPYLQWELHVLRLREQCGEHIRVVQPDQLAALDADGPLPELITLGADVMYQIRYDASGILQGAVRFTDRETITTCRRFIERLYTAGEQLSSFFPRLVAPLEPPAGQ